MTLIINIPDDEYKTLKSTGSWNSGLIECVKNGTPLDDVKAEIEQKARPYEIGGRGNGKSIRYGLCMALQIIDKYKAESEDKE